MKTPLDWSLLRDFLIVAEQGGLGPASRILETSQATLSRHMSKLETTLEKRLFLRGGQGYGLTSEGRDLLVLARSMRTSADAVDEWVGGTDQNPIVRISAGIWTSAFLSRYLSRSDGWQPEFVSSQAKLDIARRAVDIGIRNARPSEPWLSGQRTRETKFAIYAASAQTEGWIGLTGPAGKTPSGRWVAAQGRPAAAANDPRVAADMAASGLGKVVLPLFTEHLNLRLMRVSEPLEDLTSEEWLVSHHEGRHDRATRKALNALKDILLAHP